jgi:MFS family permease
MSEDTAETLYCANHPDRETMLRCNRCNKPICYQCAVLTPVGYRCKECVREQQNVYYNAGRFDLLIAAIIGFALGAAVGAVAYAFLGLFGLFGFLIAFFAGPAAGGLMAEAIRRSVGKRRARGMKWVAAGATLVGIVLGGLLLLGLLGLPTRSLVRLDVWLFAALAASTAYARLL